MLPKLRLVLRNISFRNQALQDIFKTSNSSKELLEVKSLPFGVLHNTKITVLLKTGKKREHYYNRVDISTFLSEVSLNDKTLPEIITYLNTEHYCDFDLEDDLELTETHLRAKTTSLGYIGEVSINGDNGGEPTLPSTDLKAFPRNEAEYLKYLEVSGNTNLTINPFNNPRATILTNTDLNFNMHLDTFLVQEKVFHGFSFDKDQLDAMINSELPPETIVIEISYFINGGAEQKNLIMLRDLRSQVTNFPLVNNRYCIILTVVGVPDGEYESKSILKANLSVPGVELTQTTALSRVEVSPPVIPLPPPEPDPINPNPITPENPGEVNDFDYAVIRYMWDGLGGKDLDTRTYIKVPDRKQFNVGWSRAASDNPFLHWADDNTGAGVESVLVNIQQIVEANLGLPTITISCNAYWYELAKSGNFRIQFEMYKGGQMSKVGYDWVNNGGVKTQTTTIECNTPIQNSDNIDGQEMVLLHYTPATNSGQLVKL